MDNSIILFNSLRIIHFTKSFYSLVFTPKKQYNGTIYTLLKYFIKNMRTKLIFFLTKVIIYFVV